MKRKTGNISRSTDNPDQELKNNSLIYILKIEKLSSQFPILHVRSLKAIIPIHTIRQKQNGLKINKSS